MHSSPGKFLKRIDVLVVIDIRAPAGEGPGNITQEPEIGILDLIVGRDMPFEHISADKKGHVQYHQVQDRETDAQ